MNKLLVGGDFNPQKESKILKLIHNGLGGDIINGGDDLENISLNGYNLTIWMPNITNELPKHYPKKDIGSVLICSKVLREDRDEYDAVSRIFKMNANAVIAINVSDKPFKFKLIDALGNLWVETEHVGELCEAIIDFYVWSISSIRERVFKNDISFDMSDTTDLSKLMEINRKLATQVETGTKERYFGNVSTRCLKLFPSIRQNDVFMFSARNSNKEKLDIDDMVIVEGRDKILYTGERKPSVDTPVQLKVYKAHDDLNFIIHGHAYIKDAPFTEKYFACGDVRESFEVIEMLKSNNYFNLKNHGFFIGAKTINELETICNNIDFKIRDIGFEKV